MNRNGAAVAALLLSCGRHVAPPQVNEELTSLAGHDRVAIDNSPKERERLMPAEVYLQSYVQVFGALSPVETRTQLRAGSPTLFDAWTDYLGVLGVPDYDADMPRGTETNALMLLVFERLAIALCVRTMELDLITPIDQRRLYAFAVDPEPRDELGFADGFDVLHRTFLGYPAALGPPERRGRFYGLYTQRVLSRGLAGAATKLSAAQAGWVSVCYGLARHPEFHTYE